MSSSRPVHGRPARPRWILPAVGFAVAAAIAAGAVALGRGQGLDLPRMGAAEIAALAGDEQEDHLLVVHLTSRLYTGDRLGPWHDLPEPARHVWSTLHVEDRLRYGPPPATEPGEDDEPTLADALEGYRAFGAQRMADLIAAGDGRRLHAELANLLPSIRRARAEYVRSHADALR